MSRYIDLTTKGRTVNAPSHRVWTGSRYLGVVKSPRNRGQTTLAASEPRIFEFYAH